MKMMNFHGNENNRAASFEGMKLSKELPGQKIIYNFKYRNKSKITVHYEAYSHFL